MIYLLYLLTNDDGINADGLWALIGRAIQEDDVEVLVVAPDRERSASGHAISIHHPIEVKQIDARYDRLRIFAATGTPADCVKLAIQGILQEKPDFIISGINRGANLGTDVFYSGTVSAAMEGALLGVKSMAVSVCAFENVDYTCAADFAVRASKVAANDPSWPTLVNINVPAVGADDIAGVAITKLGTQVYRDAFKERTDPKGRRWYWLGGVLCESCEPEDTDTWAVKRNMISITPLRTDLTDFEALERLAKNQQLFW